NGKIIGGFLVSVALIAGAAAAVTLAARLVLPSMAPPVDAGSATGPRRPWHQQNRRLLMMCLLTLVGVTGHFISYTFIVVIIGDIVGVTGPGLAWLLAGYGVAGLMAMALLARPGDRHPRRAVVGCLAVLTLVLAVLAGLGFVGGATAALVGLGGAAIIGWGATATAVPPMLQSTAMRHSPTDPDGASGLYVAAFQVGIMAGSLIGGVLYEHAGEPVMLATSAAFIAAVLVAVLAGPNLFASGK
ncbi:MAG TPA: MFS transporter, partial [Mycobacterium sp.]|nr:MFS transporter [Mycobacterium sp.]